MNLFNSFKKSVIHIFFLINIKHHFVKKKYLSHKEFFPFLAHKKNPPTPPPLPTTTIALLHLKLEGKGLVNE